MKRKFFAFALAMALCLCLLPISTQAMMQESDFGKWIGGDSTCPHTNTSEPYGNPPDEGDHPGTHLKVVECGDCGAQFVTRENCTDANNDKKCDGCNQNMPSSRRTSTTRPSRSTRYSAIIPSIIRASRSSPASPYTT